MTNEEILEILTPLKQLVSKLETTIKEQTAAREAERNGLDHDWFITDFIGVDSKTMEGWDTAHFKSECKYLHTKPLYYPLTKVTVDASPDLLIVRLNNVTVTPEWLREHKADDKGMYYRIGSHAFYIGSSRYVGTR